MRRGFALGAAAVALFLSLWIWLPAPTRAFLTLSVGAPEVSVWLVVMGALTTTLAWLSRRRRIGRIALAMAIAATLLPVSVLVRIPSTAGALEREMEAELGPDYLATVPRPVHARLREQLGHQLAVGALERAHEGAFLGPALPDHRLLAAGLTVVTDLALRRRLLVHASSPVMAGRPLGLPGRLRICLDRRRRQLARRFT